MQQQTRSLSGLQMAALAHDLRTPMCVAAGAAQMALEAGGRDVSVQLRQILQAVGAMDRMISMMSEAQGMISAPTFTGEMLQKELLALTADRVRDKEQKLSVDLSALDGLMLEADYAALCRLLINLLCNAIKYTQSGGEITLRAQMERMCRRAGRVRVRFIVADNGTGMTRKFMKKMFLPFARAWGTEAIEGCGLGLSIVREMVYRLDGRIRVRSIWGKGTTFAVSVPMQMRKGA